MMQLSILCSGFFLLVAGQEVELPLAAVDDGDAADVSGDLSLAEGDDSDAQAVGLPVGKVALGVAAVAAIGAAAYVALRPPAAQENDAMAATGIDGLSQETKIAAGVLTTVLTAGIAAKLLTTSSTPPSATSQMMTTAQKICVAVGTGFAALIALPHTKWNPVKLRDYLNEAEATELEEKFATLLKAAEKKKKNWRPSGDPGR